MQKFATGFKEACGQFAIVKKLKRAFGCAIDDDPTDEDNGCNSAGDMLQAVLAAEGGRLMTARIITVANLKGGVGKSNIAVNLACELGGGTRRIALVDADPQGTSTHWMSRGRYPAKIYSLPLEDERGAHRWVTKVLSIESDFVLIDCPAHSRAVTETALSLSRLAVIPLTASGPDLIATTNVLNLIETARSIRDGDDLSFMLVPSKIDHRTGAGRRIGDVLKHLGDVVGPEVRQRTAFVDAFGERKWIGDFAPKSDARLDIVNLANAVLAKLEEMERFSGNNKAAQVS